MELTALLNKLKLNYLEAQLDAVCEQAAQHQQDYKTFLVQALDTEWQGRHQRGIEARLRLARFLSISGSRDPAIVGKVIRSELRQMVARK